VKPKKHVVPVKKYPSDPLAAGPQWMNSSNELIQRPRNKQFKAEPKDLLD
jgi:hypothetical protein